MRPSIMDKGLKAWPPAGQQWPLENRPSSSAQMTDVPHPNGVFMKVSTYHTVRLTYNWKNIRKKGWHQMVSGDSVGHCGAAEVTNGNRFRTTSGAWWCLYVCHIFFYQQAIMMLRIYARCVANPNMVCGTVEGKYCFVWTFFFGSRSLLPTDVCSLSYERMKKKTVENRLDYFHLVCAHVHHMPMTVFSLRSPGRKWLFRCGGQVRTMECDTPYSAAACTLERNVCCLLTSAMASGMIYQT